MHRYISKNNSLSVTDQSTSGDQYTIANLYRNIKLRNDNFHGKSLQRDLNSTSA